MPFRSAKGIDRLLAPRWAKFAFPARSGPDNRLLQDYEILGLAGIYWPLPRVQEVLSVVRCESGGWTGAWAPEGEDSRGLLQLDVDYHPELARWNLFDPQVNFWFGYHLWLHQGWQPWSCARKLGFV